MLQDVDLSYRDGKLTTGRPVRTDSSLEVGTTLTVAGTVALTGGYAAGSDPTVNAVVPQDHGLLSWSYDPSFASNSQLLTSGTLYLVSVPIRNPLTVTRLWYAAGAAGVTPTAGANWLGVYSSAGALLASQAADALVTLQNSGLSLTLSTPLVVSTGGPYWVALLFNAATAPTLLRTNGAFTGVNNVGLGASGYRYATNGTGRSTLPSSITPGSNSTGPALWVGIN